MGGYGTIGISREEEDLIIVLKHNLVDPERGLKLETVFAANFITAHVPSLNIVRNVERAADIWSVDVVSEEGSEKGLRGGIDRHLSEPSNVLLEGETGFICFFLTINHNSLLTSHFINGSLHSLGIEGDSRLRICLSEKIIPIESLPEFLDLQPEVLADGIIGAGCADIPEVVGALAVRVVLDQARRDDVEVVHDIRERRGDINIPVSSTVSDDEPLQVVSLSLLVHAHQLVVLVDLPGEVRHIDSSITLTRDVQGVVEELGEATEEVLHGSEGILGLSHVVVDPVLGVDTDGVADTGGALDVEDVSTLVPGLWVRLDVVFTIINDEGAVLLEEGQ